MSVEKWIAGAGQPTYGAAFNAADLNSLAGGNSVLSGITPIANQTNLDIFADLSIALASITTAAPATLSVYLFPLNQDGTTYGDGQFTPGTPSAAVPSPTYWVGDVLVPVGTQPVVGTLSRVIMPKQQFLWLVQNNLGAAIASSGNSAKYTTYNRSII